MLTGLPLFIFNGAVTFIALLVVVIARPFTVVYKTVGLAFIFLTSTLSSLASILVSEVAYYPEVAAILGYIVVISCGLFMVGTILGFLGVFIFRKMYVFLCSLSVLHVRAFIG